MTNVSALFHDICKFCCQSSSIFRCKSQGLPQVRPAAPEDMDCVMAMIQELADYEKMPDGPKINAQSMYCFWVGPAVAFKIRCVSV